MNQNTLVCSKFHAKLCLFRESDRHCDITLQIENRSEKFRCHRVILSAVSTFFDRLLAKNSDEAIQLPKEVIAVEALREILAFAYTRNLPTINDANVYYLLRAVKYLQVSELEDLCIEFIGKNMTVMSIKKIAQVLLLAGEKYYESLTDCLRKHIVDNFDQISKEDALLETTVEELYYFLKTFRSSFSETVFSQFKNDDMVLDIVLRWIYYSLGKRSRCFQSLSNLINFKKISHTYQKFILEQYKMKCNFEKVWEEKETLLKKCIEDHLCLSGLPQSYGNLPSTIHVFVGYEQSVRCLLPLKILSLDMSDEDEQDYWKVLNAKEYFNEKIIQTVVLNRELYLFSQYSFEAFPSIEAFKSYSPDTRILRLPPCKSESFYMCANKASIYGYNTDIHNMFSFNIPSIDNYIDSDTQGAEPLSGTYCYDFLIDRWFSLPALKIKLAGACITADNNLLYVIGGEQSKGYVQVYDHRMPNWFEISRTNYSYSYSAACCHLNGDIYVSDGDIVERYEPEANKWEVVCGDSKPKIMYSSSDRCRRCMVPLANSLWIFKCETAKDAECDNCIIDLCNGTIENCSSIVKAISEASCYEPVDCSDVDPYRCSDESLNVLYFTGIKSAVVFNK